VFDVRPKDIAKKLKQVPSPDQFKFLRKHLNEQEGFDYPVSVLHYVYAEQRSHLEKQKVRETTKGEVDREDLLTMYTILERQVSEFRK
jgi:hypothetical protein